MTANEIQKMTDEKLAEWIEKNDNNFDKFIENMGFVDFETDELYIDDLLYFLHNSDIFLNRIQGLLNV